MFVYFISLATLTVDTVTLVSIILFFMVHGIAYEFWQFGFLHALRTGVRGE